MIILISPAKSLDFETKFNCKLSSKPQFEKEAEKLSNDLEKFSISDLEKLMNISPKLAELNFLRWKNFKKNEARQALLAFDGDVYSGIEKEKYGKDDFEFAQNHLRILSGLYGILKPMDLIKPYRLEMGTEFKKFKFPMKNLYEFWSEKVSEELEKSNSESLINLASEEYFGAVDKKKISKPIINIAFKENKNGALKIVGINAKKARGLMTNFAIKNRITNPEKLKKFAEENYKFSEKLSDKNNWVFVR
jgi:cytoplasmic iron level regulating protein YaaA (DUF328/UPF0246 family)